MAYKSKFSPKNTKKYIGDPTKIELKSLWERRFAKYCDENDSILEWGYEILVIPYIDAASGKKRRYYPDFIIRYINKNNKIRTKIIEIKPHKQTKPPKKPLRKTPSFIKEVLTYATNKSKWEACSEYAEFKGWEFQILTEKELTLET